MDRAHLPVVIGAGDYDVTILDSDTDTRDEGPIEFPQWTLDRDDWSGDCDIHTVRNRNRLSPYTRH